MAIVALVGTTGLIGGGIANGFLANKAFSEVRLLTRDPKRLTEFEAKGAKIIQVDYNDIASLTAALKGAEVVVNSMGYYDGSKAHFAVVDAAKAAGVKRFVPSEFGSADPRIIDIKDSFVYEEKDAILQHVIASGLEWTSIITGLFLEFVLTKTALPSLDQGHLTVMSDDNVPFGVMLASEAGFLVADIVLRPESRNAFVSIPAFTTTYRQIIATYNEVKGKNIQPTIIPAVEVEKRIEVAKAQNLPSLIFDTILLSLARGAGRPVDPVTKKWFPNTKFTSVRDVIAAHAAHST